MDMEPEVGGGVSRADVVAKAKEAVPTRVVGPRTMVHDRFPTSVSSSTSPLRPASVTCRQSTRPALAPLP